MISLSLLLVILGKKGIILRLTRLLVKICHVRSLLFNKLDEACYLWFHAVFFVEDIIHVHLFITLHSYMHITYNNHDAHIRTLVHAVRVK